MALFRRSLLVVAQALTRHSPAVATEPSALFSGSLAPGLAGSLSQLRFMSGSKLFVGGLAWETDDRTLRNAFSSFGDVAEAKVIVDRVTGRSRGFGFVSFTTEEDAQSALAGMDGQFLGGRTIRVDFAQQKEPRSPMRSRFGLGGPQQQQQQQHQPTSGYDLHVEPPPASRESDEYPAREFEGEVNEGADADSDFTGEGEELPKPPSDTSAGIGQAVGHA